MSLTIQTVHNSIDNNTNNIATNQKQGLNEKKSLFAGNLNLISDTDSLIEQKRKSAQRQAMKLIEDAWNRDSKAAGSIDDMKQLQEEKKSDILEYRDSLKAIDAEKEDLKEIYGVDPNSQEQKDLDLLEKFQNYKNSVNEEAFTMDEVSRLRELQNTPRTEYQNKVLELNGQAANIKSSYISAKREVAGLSQAIADAKIEQLKSKDMLNAENAADQVVDAVSDEIVGMILDEGKDAVDEKLEEEQKKAEEKQEEKEEQEERLEEAKEKKEEQEKILHGLAKSDKIEMDVSLDQHAINNVQEAQKKIQKLIKENDMLEEDLKGIEIDFSF